jgi:hypothetical protein
MHTPDATSTIHVHAHVHPSIQMWCVVDRLVWSDQVTEMRSQAKPAGQGQMMQATSRVGRQAATHTHKLAAPLGEKRKQKRW